ncbi:MAG: translation initiation factor IF-6 [Candidatus Micrarchaeota archaeon]|nr:translation initiation factor IF-6 [Candidatus Micrarchaeota archaeon]
MEAAKYNIMGSDYIGVFATATDDFLFAGAGLTGNSKEMMAKVLGVRCIDLKVSGSDLIGLFARANSNGIIISNLAIDNEVSGLKNAGLDINVCVLESSLNAVGSNILANDRMAIVNPDYSEKECVEIGDALDVEVIRAQVDGFKTVGANSILTNRGLVMNNKSTAKEKSDWDRISGFDSTITTANTGALAIGLATIANSNGLVVGDTTTGYELARILDALE